MRPLALLLCCFLGVAMAGCLKDLVRKPHLKHLRGSRPDPWLKSQLSRATREGPFSASVLSDRTPWWQPLTSLSQADHYSCIFFPRPGSCVSVHATQEWQLLQPGIQPPPTLSHCCWRSPIRQKNTRSLLRS